MLSPSNLRIPPAGIIISLAITSPLALILPEAVIWLFTANEESCTTKFSLAVEYSILLLPANVTAWSTLTPFAIIVVLELIIPEAVTLPNNVNGLVPELNLKPSSV